MKLNVRQKGTYILSQYKATHVLWKCILRIRTKICWERCLGEWAELTAAALGDEFDSCSIAVRWQLLVKLVVSLPHRFGNLKLVNIAWGDSLPDKPLCKILPLIIQLPKSFSRISVVRHFSGFGVLFAPALSYLGMCLVCVSCFVISTYIVWLKRFRTDFYNNCRRIQQ